MSEPKFIEADAEVLPIDGDLEFGDGDGDDGGDPEEYSPNRVVHLKVGMITLTVEGGSEAEAKGLLTAAIAAASRLHEIAIEQLDARARRRAEKK